MNIEDMTPEQLREYALAKEAQREAITARYMDREPNWNVVEGNKKPYENDIEFEGETYRVDMRRVKSREFVRMFGKLQQYANKGEDAPISDTLALYDHVFGGAADDKVCDVVERKLGYHDFEEIMRIESALFESIDLKN